MRSISIIGAGQAGLITAIALLRQGHSVTVYSDKTADEWLNNSRPTGNAFLFDEALAIERKLGIDYFSESMYRGQGGYFEIATPDGQIMPIFARYELPGAAVDQRLKFCRWMNQFEADGGRLIIESVTVGRAREIAAGSDLTLLAAGKAELGRLVPRDAERSVFEKPARNLAMVVVRNVRDWAEKIGFTPVKYSALGPVLGEIFWVPFTHKTAGATWSVVIEAVPGGPLDVFRGVQSGRELVERLRGAVERFSPQDLDLVGGMQYLDEDPLAWLTGSFPPTVRKAFAQLDRGELLMPIGDTAITFDPIGGQGANNASHHAKFVIDAIKARGDAPFDADWMQATFDGYRNYRGRYAYRFNNMMLEPPPGFMALMGAAAADPKVGAATIGRYAGSPQGFFPWIEDPAATVERTNALSGVVA